ncbi:hypothetical protein HJFPF1_10921 [Paramyrothecium foliicola]|nr:hypothetical protein HJFPF1_10921 [Paramyrothecium foliicola]
MEEQTDTRNFSKFQLLPPDIRRSVWICALANATPRLHAITLSLEADNLAPLGSPAQRLRGSRWSHIFVLPELSLPDQQCHGEDEEHHKPHMPPLAESTLTPRRIAAVCRESRSLVLKLLPNMLHFYYRRGKREKPGILRYNADNDTIYLALDSTARPPFKTRHEPTLRSLLQIRRLALEMHPLDPALDILLARRCRRLRHLSFYVWQTLNWQMDPSRLERGTTYKMLGSEVKQDYYIALSKQGIHESGTRRNVRDILEGDGGESGKEDKLEPIQSILLKA